MEQDSPTDRRRGRARAAAPPRANEVTGADLRRDLHGGPPPLEALKRMVRGSFELARRLPGGGEYSLEAGACAAEGPVFERLSRQVRAAQRAGALKAGDASLIAALIVGSLVGAADLARRGRRKCANDEREAECPSLLLLDLLATKGCN